MEKARGRPTKRDDKLKNQGPVFQNGVRLGVSLNLIKSVAKPKVPFFKTALS